MKSDRRALRGAAIIAGSGISLAIAAGLIGLTLETERLGRSDEAAVARVDQDVRTLFAELTTSLRGAAGVLAANRDPIARAESDPEAVRTLFEIIERITDATEDLSVTLYSPAGVPMAWGGRPSELPPERIAGPADLFVAPGPLGLRLVHIEPVMEAAPGQPDAARSAEPRRLATIAAERVLSPARAVEESLSDSFVLTTSIASVALKTRYEGAGDRPGDDRFVIPGPSGEPLLEGEVSIAALREVRGRWRQGVFGVMCSILGITLLLIIGPLLNWRDANRSCRRYTTATLAIAAALIGARAIFWMGTPARWVGPPLFSPSAYASATFGSLLRSPVDFLLTALTALGLVLLAAGAVERWRLAGRRNLALAKPVRFLLIQGVGAVAFLALLAGYELFLADTVENATIDILQFSLHPWESARLALLFGLVLFHAAAVWAGVVAVRAALARWTLVRGRLTSILLFGAGWLIPTVLLIAIVRDRVPELPIAPMILVVLTCLAAAYQGRRWIAWYRRAFQAPRLLTILLALMMPALLMYPSMLDVAEAAKRRLIQNLYAAQVARHPQELQARLAESLRQIDQLPPLIELVSLPPPPPGSAPPTEHAFLVWRQTDLARFRLTSAVELYGGAGALISRFALNYPEYAPTSQTWQGTTCGWDIFGETMPFGSDERRVLHAERGICEGKTLKGGIVVHVMLDYEALPFISSQSPYFELIRAASPPPAHEGGPGHDVELVIYGWGRLPIYASEGDTWPLNQELFSRIAGSREPFWTRVVRDDRLYEVYFQNDRAGVYALGYPVVTRFDHVAHIAEMSGLVGVAFLALLAGGAIFTRLTGRAKPGRVLLREIRQSFYRKLLIAFVGASVVPVLILALVIRTYFATLLENDVEAEAARTAAVARRVVEESIAMQQRGAESLRAVGDDDLVLISKVIDQDVNLYEGPHLIATSERDLFASGLLPTRAPDEVYRAITLQRLPRFVGEEVVGDFSYMVAATAVQLGGNESILTVPLTIRQQEIEHEIDELDRGVYLAALVFVLLGAGLGFSIAERIADPVKRLTRATRRIARGDFDATVTTRAADELQRLVESFNKMAAELKVQRARLERTHRLEAWADMARQVAHEIKNPLTPIQLSAEHLRRVHADLGRPMDPVLDDCVDTILKQVRLLRQIAAEFSSFASSPTARPSRTSLADLVREVVEPYRTGLEGRIAITIDVPDSLPPVRIDRTLVARALTNIVENALHAMPGGGSLRLASEPENRHVRLRVSDTGVGMDEEGLKRIFEPYFSTKATGTGLGLTIAKRNVELTNGTIEIESEKGRGTTVTLTLPAADPAEG